MTPEISMREEVHALWDGLADFDAAKVDQALDFLMQDLCGMVNADNALWAGLVRLADGQGGDPARGWRPPVIRVLHPDDRLSEVIREQVRTLGREVRNPAAAGVFADKGSFQAFRLRDVAPPDWFESETYCAYYRDSGRADAVYAVFPINSDTVSCFGLFRSGDRPAFTEAERDTVGYVLRGIKWFHRLLLLSHGLLAASAPLTLAERRVLHALLTGQGEKAIADGLGQSPHTTHGHIVSIYRKFGVNNRPALLALWLGGTS